MCTIRTTSRILFYSSIISFFAACSNEGPKQEQPKQDTIKQDTAAKVTKKEVKPVHPLYNDLARYIAGMQPAGPGGVDSSLRSNTEWKKFAEAFEKNWDKYDSTRLKVMREWKTKELASVNASSKKLFYPFAGADFLNAYTFFPQADTFVMIGLEPAGTIPDFNEQSKDSVNRYFNKINTSLHAILNFSFFRTKSMAVDLKNEEIDGTIHLMLLFIVRTGNSITDIKYVATKSNGELVHYNSIDEAKQDTLRNRGIEIEFFGADSVMKKAYYFSVNLADDVLKKNTPFIAFVDGLKPYNTYLKSASYLMYNSYFSEIRDHLVLGNSKHVLEDDSGMPMKFFTPETWDVQLYGSYERPIPMFSMHAQADLKEAFKDSTKVKPLPFGIGYSYRPGTSNLLLATKKK
jgi:hypothetical protein